MTRRVCVVTGTRAEYGLLRWLMKEVSEDPEMTLQIIATGMHLSPEFGLTYETIERNGFNIDRKVEMLVSSDTPVGVAKSMGLGLIGFADAFNELKPDIVVILGDRFEIFSAASAALAARIPVAHLHGGESTEGLIDEAIRHSITKMAHLHFVAAESYKKRVIQLGEQPDRVFVVGGLGLDSIKNLRLLDREKLESSLNFDLGNKSLLVTFHPVTLEISTAEEQMLELFTALSDLTDTQLIFTLSNSDMEGRKLNNMVQKFVAQNKNSCAFTSLGELRYLSCIALVDGVVGNSSSGLLEVPTFMKGTINIGDRQRGRLQASSVINCDPDHASIGKAIKKLYSTEFQKSLRSVSNPYGGGGASKIIASTLKSIELDGLLKKQFFDL